jgi:acetolactate synthase regulatory subunit
LVLLVCFKKSFGFIIITDKYDPELARYWLENDASFVKRDKDGNLVVTYDYSTFGCPIEPYRNDHFSPDLRVLQPDDHGNSTLAGDNLYKGKYILMEIFGAKGFNFKVPVKCAGCARKPQTLQGMLKDWVIRRRVFNVTAGRMSTFLNSNQPNSGNMVVDGRRVYNVRFSRSFY